MRLSEQQVRFFNTFGFLKLTNVFSPDEMARITADFETTIQRIGGGDQHQGVARTCFMGAVEMLPEMCGLIDHPRLAGAYASLLGDDFNYLTSDGNYYAGDTSWHPDDHYGELFAMKTALYLDPVREDTGCLRVIPGSHRPDHPLRKGMATPGRQAAVQPNSSMDLYGVPPRDYPGSVALETDPGDVVMFNFDLFHSSWGGSARRRMFTINCSPRATDEHTMKLLRSFIGKHTATAYKIGGLTKTGMRAEHDGGMYHPTMIQTAGPDRLRHLEQGERVHDEVFPQYARAGVTVAKPR